MQIGDKAHRHFSLARHIIPAVGGASAKHGKANETHSACEVDSREGGPPTLPGTPERKVAEVLVPLQTRANERRRLQSKLYEKARC